MAGEQAKPRSRHHVPALDGWRGVAILLVLAGHFVHELPDQTAILGVAFFFALSGRLMADILFVHKVQLPLFFFRRASRVLPALIAFVLIVWLATDALGFGFSPVWIAAALTFTLNYALVFHEWTAWLDHVWSLCVEEHAYMLLGLIAFWGRRSLKVTLWWAVIVTLLSMADGVFSQLVLRQDAFTTYFRSDVAIAAIFSSVAAYLGLRHAIRSPLVERFGGLVSILMAFAGAALFLSSPTLVVSHTLGTLCLAVAAALVDLAPKTFACALSWPPLMQIGVWSYSLYLWQQPFYKLSMTNSWLAPAYVVAALACGIASFYLLERPARHGLNRLFNSRRAKPEPAQATPLRSKPF